MSAFHSQKPSAPHTFTTGAGVTVIVKPAAPAEATRWPWERVIPAQPLRGNGTASTSSASSSDPPSVVVPPPPVPERRLEESERDAFVRRLDAEYGRFIEVACRAQGDVSQASAKDMALHVLMTAGEQFEKLSGGARWPPQNVRGWLATMAHHEGRNHWRARQLRTEMEAFAAEAFTPAPDPEGTAELAERRRRLVRHLDGVPPQEAEVILCMDLYGMTAGEAAEAVGRSLRTVEGQVARGRQRLEELARESNRATAAGERRR